MIDMRIGHGFTSYLWGIETIFSWAVPPLPHRFTSYLWGIETNKKGMRSSGCRRFTSYLWGIETSVNQLLKSQLFWFTSYLWGIETVSVYWFLLFREYIHILPMRNWNKKGRPSLVISGLFTSYLWGIETNIYYTAYILHTKNSHPTYEELKQEFIRWRIEKNREFTSYLWGIETC